MAELIPVQYRVRAGQKRGLRLCARGKGERGDRGGQFHVVSAGSGAFGSMLIADARNVTTPPQP